MPQRSPCPVPLFEPRAWKCRRRLIPRQCFLHKAPGLSTKPLWVVRAQSLVTWNFLKEKTGSLGTLLLLEQRSWCVGCFSSLLVSGSGLSLVLPFSWGPLGFLMGQAQVKTGSWMGREAHEQVHCGHAANVDPKRLRQLPPSRVDPDRAAPHSYCVQNKASRGLKTAPHHATCAASHNLLIEQ